MKIKSTQIDDTFAEAFKMWGTRFVITADSRQWARAAGRSVTGFATSVIGCKCEAGIETELAPEDTPDKRPGVSVLLFTPDRDSLVKRLVERIGQCVMTCPTTACYNGLDSDDSVNVGGQLRFFGDGYQISKKLGGRRLWRVPVMDGEFLVEERFGIQKAVGGGNLLLLGKSAAATLRAANAAVKAMRDVRGIILPFPDGVVRSGSKVGSRYKALIASTNDRYCPTLKGVVGDTALPPEINAVLEIVIDGLDEVTVGEAMHRGMLAAARPGIRRISAGNYGGGLGQYQIHLHRLLEADAA